VLTYGGKPTHVFRKFRWQFAERPIFGVNLTTWILSRVGLKFQVPFYEYKWQQRFHAAFPGVVRRFWGALEREMKAEIPPILHPPYSLQIDSVVSRSSIRKSYVKSVEKGFIRAVKDAVAGF
jgi:hypothetical protein